MCQLDWLTRWQHLHVHVPRSKQPRSRQRVRSSGKRQQSSIRRQFWVHRRIREERQLLPFPITLWHSSRGSHI